MHQFRQNGYNIIVDEQSGAVHSVDNLAYRLIGLYKSHTRNELIDIASKEFPEESISEIEDCIDDIEDLIRDGQLFSEDPFDNVVIDLAKRKPLIKALCLHVAHTCNLNCSYCFAAQGKYQGKRALMSFEVGKRAIDFLIENSGHRRNLDVDFFGGEPLMNWQVVKDIVHYAREQEKIHNKNFRFTLTTNGMLIDDEVIDFSNREMSNVVLSLDGREEVHDRLRRDYKDRGSWATIVPKFQEFVSRRNGKQYYIRGTYTHYNTDFMEDINTMLDLGFRELSLEPVVCEDGDPYALTEEDLPILFEQYDKLADKILEYEKKGDPFTFYHFTLDLCHGPCIYKRISGCGAGTEYYAVTPWGQLYPCHQFVSDCDFSMGDIWNGVKNIEAQNEFKACNVYAHEECKSCWARLYCSGGCAANAFHSTGKITGIYDYGCRLFRKRIECALMIQVAKQEEAWRLEEENELSLACEANTNDNINCDGNDYGHDSTESVVCETCPELSSIQELIVDDETA